MIDFSDLDSRQRQFKRMLQTRVETLAQVLEYNGEDAARGFLIRSQKGRGRPRGVSRFNQPRQPPPPRREDGRGPKNRPALDLQMYVINNNGIDILKRPLPDWIDTQLQNEIKTNSTTQLPHSAVIIEEDDIYSMTAQVISTDGLGYRISARLLTPKKPIIEFHKIIPFGLGRIYERHPQLMQLRIGMAILVSSLFCFGLSWYLVKPMQLLRTASRKIAAGQLDTRVRDAIGHRGDELESLGIDFDFMAERIQTLVSTQQNLLNDVSHELRSPLARIQVAVGLAQQKSQHQMVDELDRIELETTRLNDLLEQVLTLARLDSHATEHHDDYVDLVGLLEAIAADAEFESVTANKHVTVEYTNNWSIHANLRLLHRAIENIVRNAVKYTADNTTVSIRLKTDKTDPGFILIQICDSGEGVPESLLPRLFEPFFRVASARDRTTGGYGLGLAIAKRSISAHDGKISASNRLEGGLCVNIKLPNN